MGVRTGRAEASQVQDLRDWRQIIRGKRDGDDYLREGVRKGEKS